MAGRKPLPASVIARIVELRAEGLSAEEVASKLDVSRASVRKYAPAAPRVKSGPKSGRPVGRHFYDDPRFDHPPENEYDDVVPIRFFPGDLPRLTPDSFGWTHLELYLAVLHARKASLLSRRIRHVHRSFQAPTHQHWPTH